MIADPVRHLYVHIPFCPSKCLYCAFVTHVGSLKLVEPYLDALMTEIDSIPPRRVGPLETVYIGGGTPSMLESRQMRSLLAHIRSRLTLTSGVEVSMEAHPSTVDREKLHGFREAGVTRISFGAESLNPEELRELGRSHVASRALEVVELAREAGFSSVNLDLMYGLPGQTRQTWREALGRLVTTLPEHVSLYPLQIEPKTVFGRRAREGTLHVPSDDSVAEMYGDACDILRGAGYEHYEVANWALPGHRCRHNLAYWLDREYAAAGVGAHAYLKPYRTENMRGVRRYIETLRDGRSPVVHRELVNRQAETGELITLRLRLLQDGLDLGEVAGQFGRHMAAQVEEVAAPLVTAGLMHRRGRCLVLDETAVPVANEIWQRFITPVSETAMAG